MHSIDRQPRIESREDLSHELVIRPQSANEEFQYISRILDRMDFYNSHGYKVSLPDTDSFQTFAHDKQAWDRADKQAAEANFSTNLYRSEYYLEGVQRLESLRPQINSAIERFEDYQSWGFNKLPTYEILLTRYGPGGSYNYSQDKATILMLVYQDGSTKYLPAEWTVVHEGVHIGIEDSIVQKFNLTHKEKEGVVDQFCSLAFSDLLGDYLFQSMSDKQIMSAMPNKESLLRLPEIIRTYKESRG